MTKVMPKILGAFTAGIYDEFGHQYVMHKDGELKIKRALETLYQTSALQRRQLVDSGSIKDPRQATSA